MGKDLMDELIGAELRKIRNRQGLSLDQVSERMGKRPTTVSEHERGLISMTLPTFFDYCKVYGVDPAEVVKKAKSFTL